jgi:oxygen-independent coproporphyrinogen-3 oxidase
MPPPSAAYVHVPFCAHHCGYCNFSVISGRDDLVEAYLLALERELSWLGEPRPVQTLYVGGGTPTQLPPAALERLGRLVTRWFPPQSGVEITIEANPGDLHASQMEALGGLGVNRISLGAQSFTSAKLARLDRRHTPQDIRRSVELARRGPAQVSLDLIFAAPEETISIWKSDLAAALALEPDHLSVYGLTVERGTLFWNRLQQGRWQALDEETQRSMYETAADTLTAAGYEHYEVSNFARPGARCRHNQTYWLGQTYYAAGPGAARYVDGVRSVNHRSTTTYIRRVLSGRSPIAEEEQLDAEDRARERLVFSLRMLQGVDLEQFRQDTGYDAERLVGDELKRFVELGMLEIVEERLRLTRNGLLLSDSLWPSFLRR